MKKELVEEKLIGYNHKLEKLLTVRMKMNQSTSDEIRTIKAVITKSLVNNCKESDLDKQLNQIMDNNPNKKTEGYQPLPTILRSFITLAPEDLKVYCPSKILPEIKANNPDGSVYDTVRLTGLRGLILHYFAKNPSLFFFNKLFNVTEGVGFFTSRLRKEEEYLMLDVYYFSYDPFIADIRDELETNDLTMVMKMYTLNYNISSLEGLRSLYTDYGFIYGLWLILDTFLNTSEPGLVFTSYLNQLSTTKAGCDVISYLFKHLYSSQNSEISERLFPLVNSFNLKNESSDYSDIEKWVAEGFRPSKKKEIEKESELQLVFELLTKEYDECKSLGIKPVISVTRADYNSGSMDLYITLERGPTANPKAQ